MSNPRNDNRASDIRQSIGRLEGMLQVIVLNLPALEQRVTLLEQWKGKLMLLVAAIALAAGGLGGNIKPLLDLILN